jgi:hypothetical protein
MQGKLELMRSDLGFGDRRLGRLRVEGLRGGGVEG